MIVVDRLAAEAAYEEAHRLREAGDFADAEAAYLHVSEAAPSAPGPHHWIGFVRQMLGDPVGAEAAFRRALALEPGRAVSEHGLGVALLGQGRFAEGFSLLEARHRIADREPRPALPFRWWKGEDVTGKKLLIWPEEGFGDQIQYARFARRLPQRGVKASWYCAVELAPLLRANLPGVEILPAVGSVELPNPDYVVGSSSLPALFPSDAPLAAPYLAARPRATAGGIGVMPFGNAKHVNDRNRRLPPDVAEALLSLPGARSLRPEDTGARDFLDTAEIIAGLDVVVSVDTAVAHLAGAMGVPTWVLLPRIGADWRWMPDETTSPWYPSMRLFRQPAAGDWASVLSRVSDAFDAIRLPEVASPR